MSQPPLPVDTRAANQLLAELRLRITVQNLPYQFGKESTALDSLYKLFDVVRAIEKDNAGCHQFSHLADRIMNRHIRRVTAKWHRDDRLAWLASRDGGDEFRVDLATLRRDLRPELLALAQMAGDAGGVHDMTPAAMSDADLDTVMRPLAAGIPADSAHNGGMTAPHADDASESSQQRAVLAALNRAEAKEILHRRGEPADDQPIAPQDVMGLAISGGGIRSATFSLGVVQVLAARGVLPHVDLLSTVSGGGFCGSFVTSVFHDETDRAIEQLAAPHGPDPLALQHVRRNARYLVGARLWQSWLMMVQTVVGMVFNWLVPLAAVGSATSIAILWKRWQPDDELWLWFAAGLGTVALLSGFGFFAAERSHRRTLGRVFGWTMAAAAAGLLVAGGFWGLDAAFNVLFPRLNGGEWTLRELSNAFERGPLHDLATPNILVPALLTSLVPVLLRFMPVLENPRWRKLALRVGLYAAGLIVPLLAVALSFAMFAFGAVTPWGLPVLASACAAVWLLVALLLSINATSPLRIYRRALSQTFIERDKPRSLELTKLAGGHGPYHILNATVNLPNSTRPVLRERNCDFFLFSPHFVGAPCIGYAPTASWRCDNNPLDLATAMAVSGAAFSANMGLGSIWPLRALMAFLNIRLGYWMRKPLQKELASPSSIRDEPGRIARLLRKVLPTVDRYPGFLCLFYEMLGVRMREGRPWLNLSDGGHIENLAIYELLRRRCKFVVAIDGEADPDHSFHGLMTLVRHAQIDMGIRIEPDLAELRPDATTGMCRSHFHLCRIHYPVTAGSPAAIGLLLYVKSSMTGNESPLIQRYRNNNPTFPHQTTLDQFFDEEQFEAYRQLGVHIGEGLFAPALTGYGELQPTSPRDWFQRLAANLLQPERDNDDRGATATAPRPDASA